MPCLHVGPTACTGGPRHSIKHPFNTVFRCFYLVDPDIIDFCPILRKEVAGHEQGIIEFVLDFEVIRNISFGAPLLAASVAISCCISFLRNL